MQERPADPDKAPAPARRRRPPRWGLRTLGFLILVMIAMITAQTIGGYTVGTLGSLIFGLVGAGYCSVRGIRQAQEQGLWALLTKRRGPGG